MLSPQQPSMPYESPLHTVVVEVSEPLDNRYIGILLNDSVYRRIPSGRTRHESLPCYERAGRQHGVRPCYIRLHDIVPGQTTVRAFVKSGREYVRRRIPVPAVIHNRGLFFNSDAKRRIERLVRSGKQIFNHWNRYGKKTIHGLLQLDLTIREHLPETMEATTAHLMEMMQRYDALIVKPNNSSIGLGIMKLKRVRDRWELDYAPTFKSRVRKKTSFRSKLPSVLLRRIRKSAYLVQQCWPLATYRGRPFDMRVSVQRGETGEWRISGVAVKVARSQVFLTNLAQGGHVHPLETVLRDYPYLDPVHTRQRVEELSLRVANHLSSHLPHLADIGLDVGIDAAGRPLFIECNGRDLRISFREGRQFEEFQRTYSNPIGYGKFLMDHPPQPFHEQTILPSP